MRHSALIVSLACLCACTADGPPSAARRPASDTYWGLEVVDDYRYMEDVERDDVRRWARAENDHTRAWLDARPERADILERVVELTHAESPSYFAMIPRGERLFAIKRQPPREQPFLVVFESGALDDERVVVDPNEIDPEGGLSIDFYEPSHDGAMVAVSMSSGGTEDGTLSIFDVATGEKAPDEIPRVNGGTAGGSVAWTADSRGLFYTRYPYPGERPPEELFFHQQVWYHALGTPISADSYVLGEDFPKIAEIDLATSPGGAYVVAEVSYGDGGEYAYYLRDMRGAWRRIADYDDLVIHAEPADDGLYLLSRRGAPHNEILHLAYDAADVSSATLVVPESDAVIRGFEPTDSRLFVVRMVGGPMELAVYDHFGERLATFVPEEPSTIGAVVAAGDDAVLLNAQSYRTPPAWYRYETGGELQATPLVHESPADFGDCVVRRIHATAADGTRIPITVMMRRGTPLDGTAPLLLYGYGSYGITLTPRFVAHRRVWLDEGGIYAVANVRGGGAFGDEWHRAANLENKKVSIDDFAACARHLVAQGYTGADRLAIEGGSAGGLLVFGTMVHHPGVAAAVVSHVGLADMLRVETSPNGLFNITEFGTVTDETQFRGLYAASPYHHVRDGTVYPALLATTGMNDPRVEPWQPFKMVARLQASGTPNPVLLRVSYTGGHGGGTGLSERDQLLADVYTFLVAELVPERPGQ